MLKHVVFTRIFRGLNILFEGLDCLLLFPVGVEAIKCFGAGLSTRWCCWSTFRCVALGVYFAPPPPSVFMESNWRKLVGMITKHAHTDWAGLGVALSSQVVDEESPPPAGAALWQLHSSVFCWILRHERLLPVLHSRVSTFKAGPRSAGVWSARGPSRRVSS